MNDAHTDDHYATLGVTPRSEDVVIRAAYLALMHRYHPDKSTEPESSSRAQAIIAAFAVLGDPEKRLRYDWDRRRAAEQLAAPPPSRLTRGRALAAAAIVLLLVAPLAVMRGQPDPPPPAARLQPTPPPSTATPTDPTPPRAAAIAPTVAIDTTEPAAPTPRPEPTPPSDLAPPRTPKIAQPIKSPPATKTRAGDKAIVQTEDCDPSQPGTPSKACANDNLAALDRLALAFYGQSLRAGNVTKRAALVKSRNSFLGRLQACRSDPCLRSAYSTHMREIALIVESKP